MTDTEIDQSAAAALVATSVASGFRSDGQILLDRYLAQFNRLLELHRRLVTLRGAIVATPAPSTGADKPEQPQPKSTPLFAGLSMIADADETVIKALENDIDDLTKLF
jgi:hypothetical protein